MSEYTVTISVERGDDELELEVTGDITPLVYGSRRGHPDNWCPDEGGECEITAIKLAGKEWDGELTKRESDQAEEALREMADSDEPDVDCDDRYDDARGDW
jgi:hypothetical protein